MPAPPRLKPCITRQPALFRLRTYIGPTLSPVPPQSRKLFAFVSLLTFIDISCMNIGLNELTVSVQQTLNAATPVAVIGFEYILFGTMHNRYVVLSILPLLVGAILTTASSGVCNAASETQSDCELTATRICALQTKVKTRPRASSL